jgi:hypothetical protein
MDKVCSCDATIKFGNITLNIFVTIIKTNVESCANTGYIRAYVGIFFDLVKGPAADATDAPQP